MATPEPYSRHSLVGAWAAQMVQTLVLAGVVLVFVNEIAGGLGTGGKEWEPYALYGILAAAIPAMLYVRWFKHLLDADAAAMAARNGVPDPLLRKTVRRSLTLGGALCDLPMALGTLVLMLGGDKRYFIGGTLVTLAIRLSYRPFMKPRR